ncbi:unnamed protein product [Mycena citricolor]|uniref:Dolichyl-phosphate beta-glucosyltransferase n=1 Tax=Mycena citricolor TaxID=2018698 RepID=A0AAD2H471_9AGAR|nr:unnamed protein product [Mycena citricolor]
MSAPSSLFFELWAILRGLRRGEDEISGSGIRPLSDLYILWNPDQKTDAFVTALCSAGPLVTSTYNHPSVGNEISLPLIAKEAALVVPAFNETERLPVMLAAAIDHLSSPALKNSIHSKLSLSMTGRQTSNWRRPRERGAVRHGMLFSGGRRMLMVDADGASRFVDLELLWDAMDKIAPGDGWHGRGSRAHLVKTEAVVKRSLLRNILMYGLHTILRIVGVGHIRDTQCGFKLFSRAAARRIFPAQRLPTWIFDVELLLLAKQVGIPVAEVPIEWHEVEGSKLNVVTASLQMLRDLLIVRANHVLGRWKAVGPEPSCRNRSRSLHDRRQCNA